jgi:uncharacterized protein (DUF1684 family)
MEISKWEREIKMEREQKDMFFAEHFQSPIPFEERSRFKVGNEECKLQAYKANPLEERLFIPFRDVTSGKQTYGAGRYLDLLPDEHLTREGKWILDLNRAYNPWCAYNENYICPFVPPENWLKVEVTAGEKAFSLKKEV